MLSKLQARLKSRADRLEIVFNKNGDLIALSPAMSEEVTSFNANVGSLGNAIRQKDNTGTGITQTKDDLKKLLSQNLGDTCGFARVYANAINDKELLVKVMFTQSDISQLKDADVESTTEGIIDVLTPLLKDAVFLRYGVTQAGLDEITDLKKDFVETLGQNKVADSQSTVGNLNIDDIFSKISNNIINFDLLIAFYKKTAPDFVKSYFLNKKLDDSGVHHNGIQGIITSGATGKPVNNAEIVGEGKNKIAYSDADGEYRLVKIRNGKRRFQVSAPGYPAQTITLKIVRGKVLTLNIAL